MICFFARIKLVFLSFLIFSASKAQRLKSNADPILYSKIKKGLSYLARLCSTVFYSRSFTYFDDRKIGNDKYKYYICHNPFFSMIQKKRVVVVHWKLKPENPFEVFSSLKNFCLSYGGYNYNTLSNYLSKDKIAYDNPEIRIERKSVILKPKPEANPAQKRRVVPVVRRVKLNGAEDERHDLEYWLAKSPLDRISAVYEIISLSLSTQEGMDKTKIVKRKLGT